MASPINWPELLREVFQKKNFQAVLVIGFFPPIFGIIQVLSGLQPEPSSDYGLSHFLMGWVYSYIVTATLYFGCAFVIRGLNRSLPWKGNITKRLLIEVPLVLIYTTASQTFILWALEGTPFIYIDRELVLKDYISNILFSNTITVIVIALIEGLYFFRNWRQTLVAAERLEKENAQSQLANLKAQLDPHFMFNSLNVLTSLIRQDPKKAEAFVEDFARVYRHMLDVKDQMVIPLEEEMSFTQQYLRLQETRFGEGLKVVWNISDVAKAGFIPPLSLQELISNAIKHNAIFKDEPLVLQISSRGKELIVRNNLQARKGKPESTGLGLANIRARYKLLKAKAPSFSSTHSEFVAVLPIMHLEE